MKRPTRWPSPATRRFREDIQPTFPGILYRASPENTTLADVQPLRGTIAVPDRDYAHMLPRIFEGLLQIRYSPPGKNRFNAPTLSFSTSASTALARIASQWYEGYVKSDLWVACPERPLDLSSTKHVQRAARMLRDAHPETLRYLDKRVSDVNLQTGETHDMRDILSYGEKWGQQLNEVPVPRTDLSAANLIIVSFSELSKGVWDVARRANNHWSHDHARYGHSEWEREGKQIELAAREAIAQQVYNLGRSAAQDQCVRHQVEHKHGWRPSRKHLAEPERALALARARAREYRGT